MFYSFSCDDYHELTTPPIGKQAKASSHRLAIDILHGLPIEVLLFGSHRLTIQAVVQRRPIEILTHRRPVEVLFLLLLRSIRDEARGEAALFKLARGGTGRRWVGTGLCRGRSTVAAGTAGAGHLGAAESDAEVVRVGGVEDDPGRRAPREELSTSEKKMKVIRREGRTRSRARRARW